MTPKELYQRYKGRRAVSLFLGAGIVIGCCNNPDIKKTLIIRCANNCGWKHLEKNDIIPNTLDKTYHIIRIKLRPISYGYVDADEIVKLNFKFGK